MHNSYKFLNYILIQLKHVQGKYIYNIRISSENIKFICTYLSCRNVEIGGKASHWRTFCPVWQRGEMNFIYTDYNRIFFVYPAM